MNLESKIYKTQEAGEINRAVVMSLEQYGSELYGFIVNCLDDISGADDIFSDVCEDICRGIEGFQWRSSLRTWLYTLTRHAIFRYMKELKRRHKHLLALYEVPEVYQVAQNIRTTTAAYLKTQKKQRAREIRKQLAVTEQMLLILKVDRNLSWREVALIMEGDDNLREEAIDKIARRLRKQFQRMKEKLRVIAKEEGLID